MLAAAPASLFGQGCRPNCGTLQIEITVGHPKAYTAPWTLTLNQPIVLDSELLDYYCLENEKDAVHLSAK